MHAPFSPNSIIWYIAEMTVDLSVWEGNWHHTDMHYWVSGISTGTYRLKSFLVVD